MFKNALCSYLKQSEIEQDLPEALRIIIRRAQELKAGLPYVEISKRDPSDDYVPTKKLSGGGA